MSERLEAPRRIVPLLGSIVLSASLLAAPVRADDVTVLARRLASLRAEVEGLSKELASKTAAQQEALRSAARQKADLEFELNREEMRKQKLDAELATKRAKLADERVEGSVLMPLLQQELANARAYVERSLPFRRAERLTELDKLEEQRLAGVFSPERALGRLWSFLEDEFRLTRESGIYRQTIVLDGEPRLADVARIGMVMLFFQTADGKIGHTAKRNGRWEFVLTTDNEQKARIRELFEQLKKQIRVGYFELPNALPESKP